ncbi:MAG: hypothetical protein P1Q69_15090 [Candidatus Thorarchaeota archaeon]|nr:hypothetical protein [Candidatus Thorarchaeota archaeon]
MQDVTTIATIGSFIIAFLVAVWGVYQYLKKRNVIIDDEESEHNWQGGKGEFIVRFKIENNQQREISINNVRLFRNHVEMRSAPFTFELNPIIRMNSGERRDLSYRFIEPEGRSLGSSRTISLKKVVEWNGSSISKEVESKLQGSY